MLRALLTEGVDTVFAYPGGSIIKVFDALYDHQNDLKQILVRHEQGAAHAAQGYARVSGRTGVAIVTSGPGATNTITGISDAMLDNTPLVVIAGQVSTDVLGTDAFQEIDLVGVTQPITKWSYQIRRAEDIAWAVARAFYIAGTGRPGPVVLDFSKTAQVAQIDFKPAKIDYERSYIPSPDPIESQINDAVALINSAKKPLVLVGHGVELGNAQDELREFIEKGNLPAARTLLGLAALPSDHPLNMGMLGMHGNLAPNVKTNECDVPEFGKNVKPDVTVLGDCRQTLKLITERMVKADHKEWIESFKPLDKEEYDKVIDKAIHPKDGPLKMGEVVTEVSNQSPADSVLVTDVGLNQMFASRYFKYRSPRSIVTSGGLGTMGFCMPAAIGASFGAPERMILAFFGDGGFQMNIQELGTIMENQAPVKMIVMNNTYLGNVRQWQQMMFKSRYSCTHMMNPDYSKIAAAYNIPYRLITDRKELKDAVADMLKAKGPFLLETAVLEEENVMPMIKPGSSVDEMIFEIN